MRLRSLSSCQYFLIKNNRLKNNIIFYSSRKCRWCLSGPFLHFRNLTIIFWYSPGSISLRMFCFKRFGDCLCRRCLWTKHNFSGHHKKNVNYISLHHQQKKKFSSTNLYQSIKVAIIYAIGRRIHAIQKSRLTRQQ